jgi:hypothetical protein
MHDLTDAALRGEKLYDLNTWEVTMFHGKWPFYRFLGMQEPASVLFSFANLAVHAYWLPRLARRLPSSLPAPLRRRFQLLPLVGINAWLWSAIFHTRDKMWTERGDYFSAALGLLYSGYYATVRTWHLYGDDATSIGIRRTLALVALVVFAAHTLYLSLWKFDYAYNMKFNVAVGVTHNLLWYLWAARERTPHGLGGVAVLTALLGLGGLELFDFAPLARILDAHALWHASTAVALIYWYRFLLADADWVARQPAAARVREA